MNQGLQINSVAPSFSAASTQGLIQLSDYKGKWVVLICNPSAFSAARKNEWLFLAKYNATLNNKNTVILSTSTDRNARHLQWYYTQIRGDVSVIPFPLLDDRHGTIGKLYGTFKDTPTTSSLTSIFIIDPLQIVRSVLSYTSIGPLQMKDLLSHLDKLQSPSPSVSMHRVEDSVSNLNPLCDVTPIIGEYVLGSPRNTDASLSDFVIYAFALMNPDGTFEVYSTTHLRQLVNLREQNPNLKVILAIGGWGADGFSDAALTPTSRYAFAREAQRWVTDYDLDGVDLDWEYPGSSAGGITSRPEDKENFTLLITALRDVLGPDAWISVAGTGYPSYIANVEIAKIAPLLSYFNLMAYDFTAGETGAAAARHQSNLYDSDLALNTSVNQQIEALISAGMPSEKILLGVPFYGRYGALDTKTFDQLRNNFINKNGYRVEWDNEAKAPYIVDASGNFIYSYDNLLSIYFKGLYVIENCLGGMFSWQSTMDEANILQKGLSDAIRDIGALEDSLSRAYYDK